MKHSKKRNVGLLYEFLTKHAAERVVSGDQAGVAKTIKVLRKHLKEGSQLRSELRLFKSLIRSRVPNRESARRVVAEARSAARGCDAIRLDKEKSHLIREINHTFGDHRIYDQRVDGYRLFATVQSLLDEWRRPVPTDVVSLALHEDELVEHLVSPPPIRLDEAMGVTGTDADELLVRLMARRTEGKMKGVLTTEQLQLLDAHVVMLREGNDARIRGMLEMMRTSTLDAIDRAPNVPDSIDEGLAAVRTIVEQPIDTIDDSIVARWMRISALRSELLGSGRELA